MSMEQMPRATLRGYEGPLYPSTIPALVRALAMRDSLDIEKLKLITQRCAGFQSVWPRIISDDGYVWRYGISFKTNNGSVMVTLPMSFANRSPAAYAKGEADMYGAEAVVARLVLAIHAAKVALASGTSA